MTSDRIVPLSEYHRLPQADQTSDFYKRLLEVVCNNATLALFIMDEHQQCVYMNPAAEALTGYRLAETQGRALHDVIHHTRPDGRPYPLCDCPIDRAFPTNNQEQGEEVFVHKDGHFYPVAYTASPIREGDRITGTIIEVRDITQEKLAQQAHEAALQREQQLQAEAEAIQLRITHLLEHMTDAFVALDRDWRIVYLNAEAERINNKPRSEALGKTHWEEWPASVGTTMEIQYRRAIAEQVPVHFEHHYYSPPDYDLWLEIYAYPSEDGLGIFYRNINDRKQAEEALRCSEARFRVSQELSLDAFTILESVRDGNNAIVDFVWTYVNPKAAEILKHPAEELVGRRLLEVLPGNRSNSELFQYYVRVVETGEPHDIELSYNDNGITGWFRNMAVKLEDGISVFFSDITQRKQTEQALRDAEERLRVALQNAPITVFNQDRELQYTWIYNPVVYGLDEILGKHDRDYLPPEDAELLTAIKQRVLETGSGSCEEIKVYRNDKSYYYDLTIEPLRDTSGAIVGITCAAVDISKLKQVEIELRASEERYRYLVEATPQLIWTANAQGQNTYVNQQMCDFTGLSLDQLLNLDWQMVIHPEDVERIYCRWMESVQQGIPYEAEYRMRRSDGIYRWQLARAMPFRDEQGQIVQWFGTSTDITDRKQSELEREYHLARERRYIDQLQGLTNAALAINSALSVEQVLKIITDQAASIIGTHQSVTSMTLDHNWSQAITAIYLSEKYAQWQNYEAKPDGSGIYACVCHLNRPIRLTQAELEAHPRWKGFGNEAKNHPPLRAWLAAPLVGRDGQNIGLIQLSDKYEGEFNEADEALLVQLAQMAAIAVENARLYEAEQQARLAAEESRAEAQAANRIKDEFLAVLSHELRSPLSPILGWSRLLQTGNLDAERTQQALSTIERNAKLQAMLIEDLLDVSRILRGKLSLTVSPINLASIIRAALETIRLAAEVKSIQIETQLDPEVGLVLGDSTRLQQVVWNLLSNAVKFTSTGGRVEVKLEPIEGGRSEEHSLSSPPFQYAQITVSDTGKGIAPEFLPHVFEYFQQQDGATTRQFGGLGLGLAIVRHLVELHGGTIQADSPGEGLGATFIVRFPLMLTPSTVNSSPPHAKSTLNLQGVRVLVVDDDTDTRDFIGFLLDQAGARVLTATSAAEALVTLVQSTPDVLLSDIGMPGMDGYMLMQQVRRLPAEQGGNIPAIALTAYAGEVNQQQALLVGFQKHVAKPVEPEELVQAIATLLNRTPFF